MGTAQECYTLEQILKAAPDKTAVVWPLTSHKTSEQGMLGTAGETQRRTNL